MVENTNTSPSNLTRPHTLTNKQPTAELTKIDCSVAKVSGGSEAGLDENGHYTLVLVRHGAPCLYLSCELSNSGG